MGTEEQYTDGKRTRQGMTHTHTHTHTQMHTHMRARARSAMVCIAMLASELHAEPRLCRIRYIHIRRCTHTCARAVFTWADMCVLRQECEQRVCVCVCATQAKLTAIVTELESVCVMDRSRAQQVLRRWTMLVSGGIRIHTHTHAQRETHACAIATHNLCETQCIENSRHWLCAVWRPGVRGAQSIHCTAHTWSQHHAHSTDTQKFALHTRRVLRQSCVQCSDILLIFWWGRWDVANVPVCGEGTKGH